MLRNNKATNIQKGIWGNHMAWNERKTNWVMEDMLCRTSKYKQHTIMYRNDWNRIWNTTKGLMRQTEKWARWVRNNNDEREEGNLSAVCLKQTCCIKPTIPLVLLWHVFSTRRILPRDLIQGMRLRKQCLCTLLDTLLQKESKGSVELSFWKHPLSKSVKLLYRHLINFFLLTMHCHGTCLRRQKGRKEAVG